MIAWLARLRLYLIAGGVVLGVIALLLAYARVEHVRAKKARAAAEQAAQAVRIQTAATTAVDKVAVQVIRTEEKTREITRTIAAAPGAESPVPAAVLSAWRGGLRDDADPPF